MSIAKALFECSVEIARNHPEIDREYCPRVKICAFAEVPGIDCVREQCIMRQLKFLSNRVMELQARVDEFERREDERTVCQDCGFKHP